MNNFLSGVERYYTEKLVRHGAEPKGVDWNGRDGQTLRFEQLCRLLPSEGRFSIADLGCGYGALLDFLSPRVGAFEYVGVDISEAMISAAIKSRSSAPGATFVIGARIPRVVDFAVASGIFNVKLGADDASWSSYIIETLESMNACASKGFAFNCLTSYSDQERMREDLHYADPCQLFDLCKRRFSRNVALLHDYDLYEFTILVRK